MVPVEREIGFSHTGCLKCSNYSIKYLVRFELVDVWMENDAARKLPSLKKRVLFDKNRIRFTNYTDHF